MWIVEQHDGVYYSLRLEWMKEEFDKMYLSILEPIETDGKTEWVEKLKARWLDHTKLVSVSTEEFTSSSGTDTKIKMLFSSEWGHERYGLNLYFNSISRKLLENFLRACKENRYDLLVDMDLSFWKSKPFTPEWADPSVKKKANCCKVRSAWCEDYWTYFSIEEKNALIKKVQKAKKYEWDYSEYDLALENLVPTLNTWLKEQESMGVAVPQTERAAPDFSSAGIPHPDDEVIPETSPEKDPYAAPAPASTPVAASSADDLPF